MTASGASTLAGRRVVVTRERPGELARLLEARGAHVVHIPLIEVVDPADGTEELDAALASLRPGDWLLVTSAAGADRVGAIATRPAVRLGAVGTATAERLAAVAGRPVDVVPPRQLAVELAVAVLAEILATRRPEANSDAPARRPTPDSGDEPGIAGGDRVRVVVAQADRAAATLADHLRHGGIDVVPVTAYRTVTRTPSARDLDALADGVDVLALASGSAAEGWVAALGADSPLTPDEVVAIGPATADVAAAHGLRVTGVAAEHSLDGLVTAIERRLTER